MEVSGDIKQQERRAVDRLLFYFASIGASSLSVLVLVFLITRVLRSLNIDFSTDSATWVFLFLVPGALSLAALLISRAMNSSRFTRLSYGIILGYAVYSLLSILISIFSPESSATNWFLLIFLVTVVAVFSAEAILGKVFGRDQSEKRKAQKESSPFKINQLPIKATKNENTNKNSALIKREEKSPVDMSKQNKQTPPAPKNTQPAGNTIHLGPSNS